MASDITLAVGDGSRRMTYAEDRADALQRDLAEARAAERKAIELVKHVAAEANNLRRRADDTQTAERIARDELGGLRISERDAVSEVAALHQQLEVTERQARLLRTQLDEAQVSERNALELLKHVTAEASEQRKRADDARDEADALFTRVGQLQTKLDHLLACGLWARLRNKR